MGSVAVHGLAAEIADAVLESARAAGPGSHFYRSGVSGATTMLAVRGAGSGGRTVEHSEILEMQRGSRPVFCLEAAHQHKFQSLIDLRQNHKHTRGPLPNRLTAAVRPADGDPKVLRAATRATKLKPPQASQCDRPPSPRRRCHLDERPRQFNCLRLGCTLSLQWRA